MMVQVNGSCCFYLICCSFCCVLNVVVDDDDVDSSLIGCAFSCWCDGVF